VPVFQYCNGGKKVINIWLAFKILGLEMNFDNFIGVTWILCWHIGDFEFAFRCGNS
jgi:hypothetical protein